MPLNLQNAPCTTERKPSGLSVMGERASRGATPRDRLQSPWHMEHSQAAQIGAIGFGWRGRALSIFPTAGPSPDAARRVPNKPGPP